MSQKQNRLTTQEFWRACKALEEMREFVLAECPTPENTARMISEVAGCTVLVGNLEKIKQATGINWKSKRPALPKKSATKTGVKRVGGRKHRSHVLKVAIVVRDLLDRLGEQCPPSLAEAIDYLSKRESSLCKRSK